MLNRDLEEKRFFVLNKKDNNVKVRIFKDTVKERY